MAEASYGVRFNTLKPLTNAQTVRGRPTTKHENEFAFRKGSFRELLANISNVAIKLLQVLKRSVEQSLSTKYVQTMTSIDRSTLRNFTRNVVAGGCKLIFLIFDNQHQIMAGRTTTTTRKTSLTEAKMQVTSLILWLSWSLFHIFCTMYQVDYQFYQFLFVLH